MNSQESEFVKSNREKYLKYSEEERHQFWLAIIRMMRRMQSSIGDPDGCFSREFRDDSLQLEPEFRKYLKKVMEILKLNETKIEQLINLEINNIERKQILED